MDIRLSHDETQTLRELLQEFLPELKFEAARTEGKELRHILYARQTLIERLLAELAGERTRG
jgi:hypothetical protein